MKDEIPHIEVIRPKIMRNFNGRVFGCLIRRYIDVRNESVPPMRYWYSYILIFPSSSLKAQYIQIMNGKSILLISMDDPYDWSRKENLLSTKA